MSRIESHNGQGLFLLENVVLWYLLVHFLGTLLLHLLPLIEVLRGRVQGCGHVLTGAISLWHMSVVIMGWVLMAEVAIRFLVVS